MSSALNPMNITNSWMKFATAFTRMSMAASEVIVHRSIRMSQGEMTGPEAMDMVMEKATAFAAATEQAAVAAATGGDALAIATAALRPIGAKTCSNVRLYRR